MRTIRSIVAATDLGEGSDEILRAASAIARLTGAKIHVLHSFDLQGTPYSEEQLGHANFAGRIENATRELSAQIRRAVDPAVEVASEEVVIYVAHKAIHGLAKAVAADLIVLGAHRARATGDAILGSTADRVIRTSSAPCLVVRAPLHLPFRRILVPIDLSESARRALAVGLSWSEAPTSGPRPAAPAEVTVLHVVPRDFATDGFPFDQEVIAPELHRQVEAARAEGAPTTAVTVKEEVRWGDSPAAEIIRFAEQELVDLVVMGTHGHGSVMRTLIGSVTSSVVRRARFTILLVPPSESTPGLTAAAFRRPAAEG